MHNWFECKVSYEKMLENGLQKKVTEPYLVDALSFTEAEARIIEEIRPFITGEFTVSGIKRARLSELFFNEKGDRFYKIKIYFITLDEKSGAEKKTAASMLAQACNLKDAIEVLEEGMKGTLADYTIASVSETAIMDVFPYDPTSDVEDDHTPIEYETGKILGECVEDYKTKCPKTYTSMADIERRIRSNYRKERNIKVGEYFTSHIPVCSDWQDKVYVLTTYVCENKNGVFLSVKYVGIEKG